MTLEQAAPPEVHQERVRRLLAPAATIGALTLVTAALHLRDPHQSGSWGLCPSAALGFWCPGCGGLRGVNDLTHLRLGDAVSSNVLLVVVIPLVVLVLARWTLDAWTGRTRPPVSPRVSLVMTTTALVALSVFTVLRNLPVGSWLAP